MLRSRFATAALAFLLCAGASAANPLTGEEVLLWPKGAPFAKGSEDKDTPVIFKYLPAQPNGTAIVVCPGGGYAGLALDHEGEQVAQWLTRNGIAAFVLRYRLGGGGYQHPVPRADVQRAIRTVRARAAEWGIKPDHIGVLGFSAGGHLTATAATQFNKMDLTETDDIDKQSARPDFAAPIYPVITMKDFGHGGSRKNLLGENPAPELVEEMSLETQVTPETPPIFIAFTTEDQAVPVKNGLAFYEACVAAGVPVEMHLFEKGRHGLGLGVEDLPFKQWPDLFLAWLKSRGLI